MVTGEETEIVVDAGFKAPLTTTTGFEADFARPTPASKLHTGACTVPALLSEHVALPNVPT